ncbi:putative membrane protein [Pseudomonas savastanoi pv. nerii]|nr:putative membrane protein [Pseudomonas amygdali pv. ciccaronei]KPY01059.1 putative membrane protein [Pseudomonas savastanoi pv. nerii]RML21921.1 putative membrane protein [Pseudomonas savastanoi pv. retacarpa]RMR70793.1 putative membrane protein [Pseudomonas savastanoi pv. fraxini]RMS84980.1 putative membrane protein [Pseudomonas savastanoi]
MLYNNPGSNRSSSQAGIIMKTLVDHLSQYAAYHRDSRNIVTHFVGIPLIVLAVAVLLSRPGWTVSGVWVSPAALLALGSTIFYLRLDRPLGVVMAVLLALCIWAGANLAQQKTMVWLSAGVGLFVIGWIIQFIGHYYEGRKPAFIDDVTGLIIGPLFVIAELAFLMGLRKPLQYAIEERSGPVGRNTRKAAM